MTIYEESLEFHKKHNGKIQIKPKFPCKTRHDLSLAYTPGVAEPCKVIAKDKSQARYLTIKGNSVAIVSDGTRVLGLGKLGAYGAIPVMEGKAYLFNVFGGIDAFPICLDTQDKDKIIETVKLIAPCFGGINLEDIESPKCFEVEDALQDIGIPVMHDDQHGTAIAVVAGVINAFKVTKREWSNSRIIVNGAGAAGLAIAKLIMAMGDVNPKYRIRECLVCDTHGAIYQGREDMNRWKDMVAVITNPYKKKLSMKEALKDADVFIGVSAPSVINADDVRTMAKDPIIFALCNPNPEISVEEAKEGGALIVGTARSDFPNQINNLLAFPGIFRGALDAKAAKITHKMKVAAALAIASCVKEPSAEMIVPDPLDKKIAKTVAKAVKKAAQ